MNTIQNIQDQEDSAEDIPAELEEQTPTSTVLTKSSGTNYYTFAPTSDITKIDSE